MKYRKLRLDLDGTGEKPVVFICRNSEPIPSERLIQGVISLMRGFPEAKEKRIRAIKVVRDLGGLCLTEAKDMVELVIELLKTDHERALEESVGS
jgi:hypothetical protein